MQYFNKLGTQPILFSLYKKCNSIMGMKRHVRLLRIEIEKFILFFSDFSYGQEIES